MEKLRVRPVRDEVYLVLRQQILSGQLKPNEKLKEEELAQALGTSRTPVREALRKLEVEHFVTYVPHKGSVVSPMNSDDLDELYEIRTLVEAKVARRAALRATQAQLLGLRQAVLAAQNAGSEEERLDHMGRFNALLVEASGSQNLAALVRTLHETLQRIRIQNQLDPVRSRQAHLEHLGILEAIEARDPDLAEERTRRHLHSAFSGREEG